MTITVNGEALSVDEDISVADLLELRKITMPDMMTVHINAEVLERDAYEETRLEEGDDVELVFFMGGGS